MRLAQNLITVVALAVASTLCSTGLADDGYRHMAHENTILTNEVSALQQSFDASLTAPTAAPAPAAAPATGGCGSNCCGSSCGCCDDCCCHSSGFYGVAEWLFFRYHRADGVRVGVADDETAEFDFESTARITLGYVRDDGLGVRLRWWEFDHNAPAAEPGSVFQVDTYNIDLETFDTFCLNSCWDLELSAGVRYNHFVERMVDSVFPGAGPDQIHHNLFHGYGGIVGAEARRAVGCAGVLWARARASILMDDKFLANENAPAHPGVRLLDSVVGQVELAFGYDYVIPQCDGSYYFVGATAEWQQWSNFSSNFPGVDQVDNSWVGHSDVGFGGFGARAGWVR